MSGARHWIRREGTTQAEHFHVPGGAYPSGYMATHAQCSQVAYRWYGWHVRDLIQKLGKNHGLLAQFPG